MKRYQRNTAINETEIDGDIFLVDPKTDEIYYLDAISSGLWRLLDEPQDLPSAQRTYRDAFPDIDPETIDSDIAAALADLLARGLVVLVS